jgi:hypothetical protein
MDKPVLNTEKNSKNCVICEKQGKMNCPRCDVIYCSNECQVIDWDKHKRCCKNKYY